MLKPTPQLTPLQYHVMHGNGTEQPFNNPYWNHYDEGIYVDVLTGQALFSSRDKFDSGTGWPSFTKPIQEGVLASKEDAAHGMTRTEIRSQSSDTHLGHVFDDGPRDKGGMRYCMNSAALRFVPKARMADEGYGEFLPLFQ